MILAGIDEAGYGPMLGPLCVGLAGFRVSEPEIDLRAALAGAVCDAPGDRAGRVAIADSKAIHGVPGSRGGGLVGLGRGVSAAGHAAGVAIASTDLEWFAGVGVSGNGIGDGPRWYAGDALPVPWSGASAVVGGSMLGRAALRCGVTVLPPRLAVVYERAFNDIIARSGNKGATTLHAIGALLPELRAWSGGCAVRLVCDRLGGRKRYAGVLSELLGVEVGVIAEDDAASVYAASVDGGAWEISFRVSGESAWLPTALASMTAKLARELSMARFNRWWGVLRPEVKPTAGYVTDARRWLAEMGDTIGEATRDELVRRA